ncbi:MAG: hypothetical protein IIB53_12355 [Planctomycetes bacterium]|nr:hypothetical protein [Planctomycetota bacterium]MCH8260326.1 hypothetical protein [Planctomycetota bacterium]
MHVLTKIFIVLVSMLAVLLVPLVVVYAHNEDSYKSRYEQERAAASTANMLLQQAQTASSSAQARSELELQELSLGKSQLTRDLQDANAKLRQLEAALASSEKLQANIDAKLAVLATSAMAGQELTESLVNELRTLRQDAMQDAKRVVQLDEALRDVSAQLQVAVAARRAVQEELQQLREELAQAVNTARIFEEKYGRLEGGPLPPPVRNLDATVVNVRRGADQTLAEINAGSRDGVEEGWIMMVARGGNFLANLRIIAVDINRSTGVIELEDTDSRGEVQPGDRVLARSGAG